MNFSQRYDINMKLHQKLGIVLKNQDLSSTYLLTILFTRFWMWLLMRFFAYLRYSYSMEHQLSQSYLTKLVGNRIWLQIEAEIQFADSTDSMQVCAEAPEFDSGMRNIIIPRDYPLYRRDLRLNPSYIAQQRWRHKIFLCCLCGLWL